MVFSSELELRGCVLHYDPARQELCLVAEDPLGSRKRPLEKEQTLPQQTHKKREVTEVSDDDRMQAPNNNHNLERERKSNKRTSNNRRYIIMIYFVCVCKRVRSAALPTAVLVLCRCADVQ